MGNGMRLDGTDIDFFLGLDEEWKDNFIASSLAAGKAIPKSMFEKLTVKEKRYYVNRHLATTAYFESYEIPYLSAVNQKKMIDQILGRGEAFMPSQIKELTTNNQKYYKKMLKQQLSEQKIRKFIRSALLENSQ